MDSKGNSLVLKVKNGKEILYYEPPNLTKEQKEKAYNIILYGETGSGKTLWCEGALNTLLEVKFEDKFRYTMEKEENSCIFREKNELTIYFIKSKKGKVYRIIEIPDLYLCSRIDYLNYI